MDKLARANPHLTICLHVDDFSVTATHEDEDTCAEHLIRAGETVQHEISTSLRMQFASDKGFVIASTEIAATRIAAQLPMPTTAATTVRRLGIDNSLQLTAGRKAKTTPSETTRWHRMASALLNAKNMPALFPAGALGIFVCGILPSALYGSEHYASDPRHITKLRSAAIRAWGPQGWGVHHDLAIMLYPTQHDPLFQAVCAPLHRWARECWLSTHPEPAHPTFFLRVSSQLPHIDF
jgi:hypothetical protein